MDGRHRAVGAAISVGQEVANALATGRPVLALESAVLTHGLPRPTNVELALALESIVRDSGAVPATVGVVRGTIRVGLNEDEIWALGEEQGAKKLGARDLAGAVIEKASGGTTVGATMLAAAQSGISVFATGGVGGVHRENAQDVSADLHVLGFTPIIVVSAGVKAILDIPRTLEYLETLSIPVIGYRTTEFPAFYSRESGLGLDLCLTTPEAIAQCWKVHRSLGLESALLIANPAPTSAAIPASKLAPMLTQASQEAVSAGIHGKQLTPFLLQRINELTDGEAMKANLALLKNNAGLGAEIACAVAEQYRQEESSV